MFASSKIVRINVLTLLLCCRLVDSVGRLLAVAFSANPWTGRKTVRFWIVHLTTAATGLSILFFAWSHTLVLLCAWGGLNGLFLGLRWSLFPGLQIDLFGAKRFSTSWSYGSTLMGMGSLLLPPFGGKHSLHPTKHTEQLERLQKWSTSFLAQIT